MKNLRELLEENGINVECMHFYKKEESVQLHFSNFKNIAETVIFEHFDSEITSKEELLGVKFSANDESIVDFLEEYHDNMVDDAFNY